MASSWIRAILLLVLCSVLAGCDGNGGGSTISGSVLLDGKPLAGADVQFLPKSDTSLGMHRADTDSAGKFTLKGVSNIPIKPGSYVVLVSKLAVKEGSGDKEAGGKGAMVSIVPRIYNNRDQTPLHADIKEGNNKLPPFELSSTAKK